MRFYLSICLMLMLSVSAFGISIYDIQYTTVPGTGNNYPSLHLGEVVSTEGIVSGTGFTGGKYTITEGTGAWKGVYVNDPAHSPELGDRVSITGTVNEVSGLTEIGTVTAYNVISSGNDIPEAASVNLSNIQAYPSYSGEAYEGVLIKVTNVTVSVTPVGSLFTITAGGYNCQVNDGFYPQPHTWTGVILGQVWSSITGIVNYASGQFRINPRDDSDMIPLADISTISLKIDDVQAKKGETKAVNVIVSKLEESWGLNQYTLKVGFNKRILSFVDADITSTLSDVLPDISLSALEDSVYISYTSDNILSSETNNGILLKLLFRTHSYGSSVLDLTQGTFNDSVNVTLLTDGSVTIPIQKKIAWLNIYNNNYNKKNIFNPWLNQKITIEYGALVQAGVASSKAIIRIYDIQGRLVATPVNKIIETANGIEYLLWDGRDRNLNLLPIGVYYCHLEIIDRVTGASHTEVQPIVVADALK